MVEGKRKGGMQRPEDVQEIDDGEEQAAASLFGDEGATTKKGKKTKVCFPLNYFVLLSYCYQRYTWAFFLSSL